MIHLSREFRVTVVEPTPENIRATAAALVQERQLCAGFRIGHVVLLNDSFRERPQAHYTCLLVADDEAWEDGILIGEEIGDFSVGRQDTADVERMLRSALRRQHATATQRKVRIAVAGLLHTCCHCSE